MLFVCQFLVGYECCYHSSGVHALLRDFSRVRVSRIMAIRLNDPPASVFYSFPNWSIRIQIVLVLCNVNQLHPAYLPEVHKTFQIPK